MIRQIGLGWSLEENIYATNLFKNFFVKPPTQIKEVDVFKEFPRWWLPFLRNELNSYPNIPVITLGEPLLSALVDDGINRRVRYYWRYTSRWKLGETTTFRPINPTENRLSQSTISFSPSTE